FRYYMPWLGRWLSSDPAGTIDGLNLYRMVRNNPVTHFDQDGLLSKNDVDKLFLVLDDVSAASKGATKVLSYINDIMTKNFPADKHSREELAREYMNRGKSSTGASNTAPPPPKELYNSILQIYSTNVGAKYINSRARKQAKLDAPAYEPKHELYKLAMQEFNKSNPNSDRVLGNRDKLKAVSDYISKNNDNAVTIMQEALASNKKSEMAIYYRGSRVEENSILQKVKEGDILSAGFFVSVSKKENVATKFSGGSYHESGDKAAPITYSIIGKPIEFKYGFANEEESLFNFGTKFKVTKKLTSTRNRYEMDFEHYTGNDKAKYRFYR
ncbi:RHS repeat-associated core domain-containing protein, partial [Yersinia mollaretii]|uniref:RHS repeat-associated core domain-containing protein n=1 Tax=Yersinia mollaretii TaxID=33060 RepID=UPI001FCB2B7D